MPLDADIIKLIRFYMWFKNDYMENYHLLTNIFYGDGEHQYKYCPYTTYSGRTYYCDYLFIYLSKIILVIVNPVVKVKS